MLTGSRIGDNSFRISKVSPPCVLSNSKCGCVRDAEMANAFIAKDYEDSEHTRSYIGEWHTHPEQHPRPSYKDYNAIIDNYSASKLAFPFIVMIIVGTESLYTCIYDGTTFTKTDFLRGNGEKTCN